MTHKTFGETFRYAKLNKYEGLEGNLPLRYGDIFMGIEVEAEKTGGRRGVTIPGSFRSVQDGSLKVDGMEFVTVPIKLLYIEKELERLFGAIPGADFSTRTSIHVHMNARDFTIQNVIDFTILYTLFERNLYRYSGDRWNNNFCIPLQLAPNNLINLFKYFSANVETRQDRVESDGIRWSKYLGYNLSPLTGAEGASGRYGTIEFRQMKGNNNIPFIINWCNLITCLKFYARSVNSADLMASVLVNEGHTFTEEIFRQWTPLITPDKESVEDIKKANTFLKYCMRKAGGDRNTQRHHEVNLAEMLGGSTTWAPIRVPRPRSPLDTITLEPMPEPIEEEIAEDRVQPVPRVRPALPPILDGETYQMYLRRIRANEIRMDAGMLPEDIVTTRVTSASTTTSTAPIRVRRS